MCTHERKLRLILWSNRGRKEEGGRRGAGVWLRKVESKEGKKRRPEARKEEERQEIRGASEGQRLETKGERKSEGTWV